MLWRSSTPMSAIMSKKIVKASMWRIITCNHSIQTHYTMYVNEKNVVQNLVTSEPRNNNVLIEDKSSRQTTDRFPMTKKLCTEV